ncbi:acyltransferase [Halarchaeum sp. P4]|uniref:acyltransferase n=1 Tax=Halarchaeum sp. P4 TaxID=3421639 RepID=UPI003EBC4CF1
MNERDHGAQVGPDAAIAPDARLDCGEGTPTDLGPRAVVRSGSVLYADVTGGADFTTGHNALVREDTTFGDDVLVGTNAVIDGASTLGSRVSLQTNAYVPRETTVGDDVFVGPNAVLTNDPYPVRENVDLAGPTLEDGASVGANATVLPDVTVGADAFVAAGAVVTGDVPARTLAVGAPATHRPLPDELRGRNEL